MDWQGKKVLVTGGAGFIGSHLAERLLDEGADVRIADNFSRGKRKNIKHISENLEVHEVDLRSEDNCVEVSKGVEHIFHLAASVGGINYIQKENVAGYTPSVLMNTNMLEASRKNDIENFLFASSACIYRQKHDDLNRFKEEEGYPADPHSTYGWAKIQGEIACKSYYEDYGIKCAIPRIFNAYGEREHLEPKWSHVIPSFIRKAVEYPEKEFRMFGDGSQERGFIHVDDLVEGLLRNMVMKNDSEPLNLGNAQEVISIKRLAEKIIEISGKDIDVKYNEGGPEGTYKYCADTTKMEKHLDWKPRISLDDGLRRTYKWAEEVLK